MEELLLALIINN